MQAKKITAPKIKAEGFCSGHPYNTELASINGVSIHFWVGDVEGPPLVVLLKKLTETARRHRDIVGVTFSDGAPTGFWAKQDMV